MVSCLLFLNEGMVNCKTPMQCSLEHISQVSLLFSGLQCGQAGNLEGSQVLMIYKFQYPATCKCFLVFNAVVGVEWSKSIS